MLQKIKLPERLADTASWIKNFLQVAKPWAHKHGAPYATRMELFPDPEVITVAGYNAWHAYSNTILSENAAIYAIVRDHWNIEADGTFHVGEAHSHYKYAGSAAAVGYINAYNGVATDLLGHTHVGDEIVTGVSQFLIPLNSDNQQFEYYMATSGAGLQEVEVWLDGYVREINV